MLETQVQSLGQEDLLEKEMIIHFNIVAWRIPWTDERFLFIDYAKSLDCVDQNKLGNS